MTPDVTPQFVASGMAVIFGGSITLVLSFRWFLRWLSTVMVNG